MAERDISARIREKRETVFERLDQQVNSILQFQRAIATYSMDTPPMVVAETLHTVYQDVARQLQPLDATNRAFLTQLERGVASLVEHNQQVHYYQEHPETISATNAMTIPATAFDHIVFRPFCIVIQLRPSAYRSQVGVSKGCHMPGTPFVFIRNNVTDLALVEQHELTHALTAGPTDFQPPQHYPGEVIASLDSLSASQIRQRLEQLRDGDIINAFRAELIAQLPNLITLGLTIPKQFSPEQPHPFEALDDTIEQLSTAGQLFKDVWRALRYLEKQTEDTVVQNYCRERQVTLLKLWLATLTKLAESITLVNRKGGDAPTVLEVACLILRPTQYRSLPEYLHHRFPN